MTNTDAYSTGYAIGTMAFLLTLGLIFWYVGRWGWLGVLIRIVCAGLVLLRILPLLANLPNSCLLSPRRGRGIRFELVRLGGGGGS